MKRTSNRKVRLNFQLSIKKEDGSLERHRWQLKTRVLRFIEANSAKEWYLKVEYYPDVYNHGAYRTKEDLVKALNQFMEKDLLDYVMDGEW